MLKSNKLVALVVSEGLHGSGDVIGTILVPAAIVDDKFRHAVRDLYEYGNQLVTETTPDFCATLEEVERIFNEMNPPTEEIDSRVDSHSVNCIMCGKLVDERECVHSGDLEGSICKECYKE